MFIVKLLTRTARCRHAAGPEPDRGSGDSITTRPAMSTAA